MVDPTHVAAVGPTAAILYARIVWRSQQTGTWRTSRKSLMEETGLTAGMLRTAVAVLREREWITTTREDPDSSLLTWAPVYGPDQQVVDLTPPLQDPQRPPARSAMSSCETEETTTLPHLTGEEALFEPPAAEAPARLRAVPSEADLDAEFVGFWKAYPRKVSKKAARLRYAKVRRTATVEQIAGALRAALPALQERDPQFVPHPASWLNAEPWQDGPAEVVPSPMTNAELCSGRPLTPQRQAEVDAWNAQARTYPVTR